MDNMDTDTTETATYNYPPPVNKLLTYGDYRNIGRRPDYLVELGLGPEHIPDLIRMATDPELRWAYSDTLEVWAPIHAWRALGQLHAEAAIEPLLPLFDEAEDDDWVMEDLPEVYGMIGPAAIPAITAYMADESHGEWPRIAAMRSLAEIGKMHPEARDECIAALSQQLELFDENDPEMNGFLINDLLDLKAVETASLMKRAFDAGYVDESIVGDWDEVQVALGLKSRAEVPVKRFNPPFARSPQPMVAEKIDTPSSPLPKTSHKDKTSHKKTKNKMAKQSRKKNRKR